MWLIFQLGQIKRAEPKPEAEVKAEAEKKRTETKWRAEECHILEEIRVEESLFCFVELREKHLLLTFFRRGGTPQK